MGNVDRENGFAVLLKPRKKNKGFTVLSKSNKKMDSLFSEESRNTNLSLSQNRESTLLDGIQKLNQTASRISV